MSWEKILILGVALIAIFGVTMFGDQALQGVGGGAEEVTTQSGNAVSSAQDLKISFF